MMIPLILLSIVISCLGQFETLYVQPIIGEVQVDGNTPSVSLGSAVGEFGKGYFKVSFWFKTSETQRYFDLLGNRVQGSHGNFFSVRMTGNHETQPAGRISVEIDQDGAGTNYAAVSSDKSGFNDGQWHHVIITRTEKTLKLWIDESLRGSADSAAVTNIANVADFVLGRSYSGFAPSTIRFRDVRIHYNTTGYINPVIEGQVDALTPFISLGAKIGEFGTSDFSIAFWFQTTDNSRLFDILGSRTQGSHGNFIAFRLTGAHESAPRGKLGLELDQDGAGTNYCGVASKKTGLNDGKWHHVVLVRSSTSLKLFVDSLLEDSKITTGVTNLVNMNEFKLGKSYYDFPAVNIKFSDVRIYQRAITDGEVLQVYNS